MVLHAGTRIGHYEVLGSIGAGGMGEVYRARDTRLNRDVALKVLPQAYAADGDRLARFEREAQVLASLNRPEIAAIYGLEESGPGPPLAAGRPTMLFEMQAPFGYDVAARGRFLIAQRDPQTQPPQVHVVLNWLQELTARVPGR